MNTTAEMFWALLDAAAIALFITAIFVWADLMSGVVSWAQ